MNPSPISKWAVMTTPPPLAQEPVPQAAVDGDDVARRLRQPPGDEQEDGLRLVLGLDRNLDEGALGVEVRQLLAQALRRLVLAVTDLILPVRRTPASARETPPA